MLTLPVEQWIGNAAAVLSGTWGAITRRSEQSGYSRTAIYTHATRVVQAVANEQAGGLSDEELWAEYERLRAENQDLWQAWAEAEELSEAKQREVAASGSAMGLSLTQVVTVFAIVLPRGVVPSRATVGRWVQQAAVQAGRILARNEHSCHSRQSSVFPLSGYAINLRFEHPVFHPMACYFKVLFACATNRATINVPPDLCYERFWHRHFG